MAAVGGHCWLTTIKKISPKLIGKCCVASVGFCKPYQWQVAGFIVDDFVHFIVKFGCALLFRQMIDEALPAKDLTQLTWLGLGLVIIPLINGLIGVAQRRLSAGVGEGIIYDLRRAAYGHMQRMSLRFFTQTRTGELMSRLNNDVIGAQSAITGTLSI